MVDIQAKLKEIGPFVEGSDDDLLVCRCEEVTKGQIRKAVHEGIFTLEEMRRYLRSGMGLCQGQTCGKLVKAIIASELKVSPAEVVPASSRAPMRPIEMCILAEDGGVFFVRIHPGRLGLLVHLLELVPALEHQRADVDVFPALVAIVHGLAVSVGPQGDQFGVPYRSGVAFRHPRPAL